MTGWEPATEAEVAMRDALRAQDQQLYFRLLTRVELLLPVAGEGSAGAGWGTWTTGGRTHILAFTSVTAMRACLGENAGATRRVPYADLATDWPNHEWWLAVNPGLPIEGYLPAWFVAQLSRGDVRLPGRTMGARARLERVQNAARSGGEPRAAGEPGTRSGGEPGTWSGGAGIPRFGGAAAARSGTEAAGRDVPAAPLPGTPPGHLAAGLGGMAGHGGGPAGGHVPAPADEPATVPFPVAPPGAPAATSVPDPAPATPPPALRRPEPANGHPGAEDAVVHPVAEAGTRDGGPGRLTAEGLLRRGGGLAPPADRATAVRTGSGPEPGSDSLTGWVSDLRRRPDEPDVFDGTGRGGPTNGRSAAPAPPPARSFFEPTSGRSARRPSPLDQPHRNSGERAVPPSRFARGSQPFPRRRPLDEPVPGDPTQAFRTDDAEPTRALRPGRPEEPPRPFQPAPPPVPPEEATPALPRRRPRPDDSPDADERTAPLPANGFAAPAAPAEELPPSIAEPVSAPPAGRRGFSPIVIEGTVIEARDLVEPQAPAGPPADPDPVVPEPYSVPTVPATAAPAATAATAATATTAATAASAPPPPYRAAEAGLASPAGPTDSTLPLAVDPSTDRVDPAATDPPGRRAGSFFAPPEPPGEPTVPLFEPAARSEKSLFDPAQPPPRPHSSGPPVEERPEALFAPAVPMEERTEAFSPAPAAPARATPAARETPTEAIVAPPLAEPTPGTAAAPVPPSFVPANEVEEELLGAAGSGSTDSFLTTLLLARVLLPAAADSAPGSRPGDPGFVWGTEQLDGGTYVVVYTSPERLADRVDPPVDTVRVKFVQLIRRWPDESWSFAVNPGTPVGATYPGEQVLALANWAAEVGLGDDPESEAEQPATGATPTAEARPAPPRVDPTRPVTMQKAVAASQLAYYLERGYDRVSGFVHRANELAHLGTPAELYDALGLGHPGSPFSRDADEIYVLRWPAYRPSLYRIPYGGQNEAAMRAMEGWVIERPPFRGNGFAPGESSDVVAEFKVDSARLPHGAQLWRIAADRTERVVAVLDTDAQLWRQVGAP